MSDEDIAEAYDALDSDEEDEEYEEDEEEEEEEEEDAEEEPSIGFLADQGDNKALREVTKLCKKAGVDPDDYETWEEAEAAISEDEDEAEAEPDHGSKGKTKAAAAAPKAKREKSVGKKADEEEKPAIRELTKRCKAVDLDPEDYETWVQVERELKPLEKEAARPKLKITKAVEEEIGEEGEDAVSAAKRLVETAERTYYTLGGVLAYIDRNKTYEGIKIKGAKPYQGKEGFEAFCEENLGIAYRKAKYLIAIYEAFTTAGLSDRKIASIGWSKAKELVAILREEPETATKWLELAKTTSTGKLAEAVKARMTKIGAKTHGNSGASARTVICKFSVHQDEGKVVEKALNLAKEQMDSTSDSEAFGYIMKEWLGYQG
jgi:hypothetical protein